MALGLASAKRRGKVGRMHALKLGLVHVVRSCQAICFAPSLALSAILGIGSLATHAGTTLHVATGGNDQWSGGLSTPNARRTDGPFATLTRAQQAIRSLKQAKGMPSGGVEVVIQGGIYQVDRTLEFTQEDSGTVAAPVVYRAPRGQEVRLVGGKVVAGFQLVSDPAVLSRLDESARGKVWQADLRARGLTDYGAAGGNGLELFFGDRPMPLSRWPNEGFVKLVKALGTTPVDVRGTKGRVEGIFTYEGDRPSRWTGEKDAWVHGYWFWDWADQRHKVQAIDVANRSIAVAPPYHSYGYREEQWFYAYNLLSEIDRPGEWYLERETGILYFWPPAPLSNSLAVVSVLPTLVNMLEVSHVTLRGLTFEATRGTAITISGGAGCRVVGCTIRNVGSAAVEISGGADHGVVGCDVYQCGAGGLSLSGGDRTKLSAAGHFADNNHIHHYGRWRPMYSAGIGLYGVGNRATHNLIDNAPHQAISFGGNDHQIEFNEIHSVCHESNDAGAIYAGRDWTMRGTVIRNNYLHDITGFEGRGCVGVYLDDMYCGTEIKGNLFYRVTSAAFIGGGRDCTIENNIFVDCSPAVHIDARALGWAKYHADEWVKEGESKGTLSGIDYRQPPYRDRYPKLPSILAEDPWAPRGNLVVRNICVGGKWDDIESRARPLVIVENNLLDTDPRFVDASRQDFQLRPDSPAFRLGFQRIPLEKIGPYQDPSRATWPVQHAVLPVKSR